MIFKELSLPVRIMSYILLTVLAISILYPLVWMSYTAFKSNSAVMNSPFGLPTSLDVSNIQSAWERGNFSRLYANSLIVTMVSVFGIIGMATAAGYALARYDFRWKSAFLIYFMIGIAVPTQALLMPGFKLMSLLDNVAADTNMPFRFRNSLLSLIVTYFSWTSIAIVFIRAYFGGIPPEMEEAARVDGANEWQIFYRIMVPLAMPAIVTMGIFYFIWVWNDFLWPLLYTQELDVRTIPLGLFAFKDRYNSLWGQQMAALSLATWPPIIFYMIFRNRIQRGLTEGALKF
ncbi:MAG: carbohydrate ABC transporter permease [Anaerolineales bacterium]|nr:carbohydrate ABC transporter permease [Anaerolineales bacterium]